MQSLLNDWEGGAAKWDANLLTDLILSDGTRLGEATKAQLLAEAAQCRAAAEHHAARARRIRQQLSYLDSADSLLSARPASRR
jgi:hypothetical protein